MKTIYYKRSFAASIAVILAACGGGGGSSSPNGTTSGATSGATTSTTTGSTNTPITVYAGITAVVAPTSTGDAVSDALNWTNYVRTSIGLEPFKRNSLLEKAAVAHSNYISLNNSYMSEGHNETAGKPGFTGVTPSDRVQAAGYPGYASENMSGSAVATYGAYYTQSLIDAPYHRQAQLGSGMEVGVGLTKDSAGVNSFVMDFGGVNNSGPSADQLVAYPAAGQTSVPLDWFVNEIPSPAPDLPGQRVGYPISISSPSKNLTVTNFTLADDKGVTVASRLLTTRTDSNQSLGNYAFIMPLAALAGNMKYTAHATGNVGSKQFDVSWSFTTMPITQLTITPSAPSLSSRAGDSITVALSGGTSRSYAVYSGNGYSAPNVVTPMPNFATISYTSPSTITLTRTSTACVTPFTACNFTVTGSDSSGQKVSVTIPIN